MECRLTQRALRIVVTRFMEEPPVGQPYVHQREPGVPVQLQLGITSRLRSHGHHRPKHARPDNDCPDNTDPACVALF